MYCIVYIQTFTTNLICGVIEIRFNQVNILCYNLTSSNNNAYV